MAEQDDINALKRMNFDGSDVIQIASGNVDHIFCTSMYTFFQFYGSDTLYRTPTYGLPNVQTFYVEQ